MHSTCGISKMSIQGRKTNFKDLVIGPNLCDIFISHRTIMTGVCKSAELHCHSDVSQT